VEKTALIHNTASDPLAIATAGTTISRAIEDNIRNMAKQIKDLHEKNIKLE